MTGTDKEHKPINIVQARTIVNAMAGPKKSHSEMFTEVIENLKDFLEVNTTI